MRLPGVTLTGTFNPANVDKRVKTMATNILKAGEAYRHGKARNLAQWAANQVGLTLRDKPRTIPSRGLSSADKQAVYELAISYVTAQLLRQKGSNYSPHHYHQDQMTELKDTVDSWYTGRPKTIGHHAGRHIVSDLPLYQFSESVKNRIIAVVHKPLSGEQLKKSQEAIALLSRDTVVTFDIPT